MRIFRVTYIFVLTIIAMARVAPMGKCVPRNPGSHNVKMMQGESRRYGASLAALTNQDGWLVSQHHHQTLVVLAKLFRSLFLPILLGIAFIEV